MFGSPSTSVEGTKHESALVWIQLLAAIAVYFRVYRVGAGCARVLVPRVRAMVQLLLGQRGFGLLGHICSCVDEMEVPS